MSHYLLPQSQISPLTHHPVQFRGSGLKSCAVYWSSVHLRQGVMVVTEALVVSCPREGSLSLSAQDPQGYQPEGPQHHIQHYL